jgi:hypothetical protein
MHDLDIIINNEAIKTAFGSYSILDQFEVWEHPVIYQFARIVTNYLMMTEKLDELNGKEI